MVRLSLLHWDSKRAQKFCASPFGAWIQAGPAATSQLPGPPLQCMGKTSQSGGGCKCLWTGQKATPAGCCKTQRVEVHWKALFSLDLCLGCCVAPVDLLEQGSMSDMSEKGGRRERPDCGRMLSSVSEATWELISALQLWYVPSRQLSAPVTGGNVSYSPSYLVPLSESVVTISLWTDLGQSWRVPSALGLQHSRAIPYLWSLWPGRGDCCHHPLFL